jgi:tol-pal system protein YbgF
MKKSFLFSFPILLISSSVLYAESRVLPPVVDNSTYSGGGASYRASAPSANGMYEVIGRLEQLQHEVQQLRGVVEEQSQTISDLQKRQGNIYSDLDLRLQALTGNDVQHKVVGGTANQATQSVINNSRTDSRTDSDNGQYVSDNPAVIQESPKVVYDVTSSMSQKEWYQDAYETLRNGHNTRAIAKFKSLLTEFPDGEYADNAQYWLGEAYKANQDFNSAKSAFSKVVSHFGGSPKVPDALLKLGYIELEQNNMAKARDYLTQVTVSHPGTTAAHLAANKLMQMDSM